MIKKYWKTLLITSIVTLLPMVAGLLLWNRLPAEMPFHWNVAGEVDGWASRWMAVFVTPLLLMALQWVCIVATSADPKKASHSEKVMHLVLWLVPVLSIFVHTLVYMAALGKSVRVEMVMPMFMGLVFTVIGNYLPKCKQNYTIGIKIPWTLHSEENWNRTHRFTGRVWVVSGIVMMLSGFFGGFWVFLAIAFLMVFVPFIYSFVLHRKGI
jgi:uncharacterized membrane protein